VKRSGAKHEVAKTSNLLHPLLAETVHLAREAAAAKSERLRFSPYEALMDAYEPGLRTADVEAIFGEYLSFLPDFLARVLDRQRTGPSPQEPRGFFSIAPQRALAPLTGDALVIGVLSWIREGTMRR